MLTGIFARWLFVSSIRLAKDEDVVQFQKYRKRFNRRRDPSNAMSDGLIHALLGIGIWMLIIFALIAVFD